MQNLYADDFVICCRSRKGAERVLKSVKKLLEDELGLVMHPEKTKIVDNLQEPFTFLGYTFTNGYWHKPSEKAVVKFKDKIRKITRRLRMTQLRSWKKIKKLHKELRKRSGKANFQV